MTRHPKTYHSRARRRIANGRHELLDVAARFATTSCYPIIPPNQTVARALDITRVRERLRLVE